MSTSKSVSSLIYRGNRVGRFRARAKAAKLLWKEKMRLRRRRLPLGSLTALPNILTLSRLLVVPVIIALLYVKAPWAYWLRCGLFMAAAATDFLDGYLARRFAQLSRLGQLMDPLADKILTLPVLIMLTAMGGLPLMDLPIILFIVVREICVPTLRERHAELAHKPLLTSKKAQWKTALLMLSLTALLIGNANPELLFMDILGRLFLYASALFAAVSFIEYLRATLSVMRRS